MPYIPYKPYVSYVLEELWKNFLKKFHIKVSVPLQNLIR